MAETKIEWADYTFNPWRGCTKVSPGCQHCYAETLSKRNPSVLGEWGPDGTRPIAAESGWRQPLAWDRAAGEAGERRLVFCASLADVFEDRPDLEAPRRRTFKIIEQTPNLIWLLLTKRPENIGRMWMRSTRHRNLPNVWLGVSVENQRLANERIPGLAENKGRASGLFLSIEPLLEQVSLYRACYHAPGPCWCGVHHSVVMGNPADMDWPNKRPPFNWVIVGGESGQRARPIHPLWVRSLRDECAEMGVPFFFKQWGEWVPTERDEHPDCARNFLWQDGTVSSRVGKKTAGAMLDGREYREFPVSFGRTP